MMPTPLSRDGEVPTVSAAGTDADGLSATPATQVLGIPKDTKVLWWSPPPPLGERKP